MEEKVKEKQKWGSKRVITTITAGVAAAVAVAIICAILFPNPLGANVILITKLIAAGTVLAAIAMLALWIYRARKNKRMLKIFSFFLCIFLVVVIALNVVVSKFSILINQFLHKNTVAQEQTAEEYQHGREITELISAEGVVLLRNEADTLPITDKKVNIFGYASQAIVYGGSGSGSADESKNVSLTGALEDAGFALNQDLITFYQERKVSAEGGSVMALLGGNYNIPEPSVDEYGEELLSGAKEFSDTAVVVFSRNGGEGADMPFDMADYEGGKSGEHYMELTDGEEAMLQMVNDNFEHTVVLVNSSSPIELGFLEDKNIDAALWIGGPGSTGLSGVAKVLSGEVNPSGRLTDTYAYDVTSSPAFMNAGSFSYTGTEHEEGGLGALFGSAASPYYFVNYKEGIYVGYRYYETAAFDGYIDYNKTVQYPFGYGLSYTEFEQTMSELSSDGKNISVDITVKNIGNKAGKEVVQLYFTPPYTKGGIEKAHVVLSAFGKTAVLEPGQSEKITLSFAIEDMASYDYKNAKAYVLDTGNYEIKLMKNSHEMIDSRIYNVVQTVTGRDSDMEAATNQFDDAASNIVYVSRADWAGTMPAEKETDKVPTQQELEALQTVTAQMGEAEDIIFKKHGLKLADLKGLPYDDSKWEQLLEQLSIKDMKALIGTGGWQSIKVPSVGKPEVLDVDGPAGLNGLINGTKGNQYTSEVVVASTWNTDMAQAFGKAVGEEAYVNNVSGLYGPAMNIHRTPFSGRNFEYYSEDGFLSGKMGAAMVRGCNETNTYTYIKHFALNDQETHAIGLAVWANEQAIRELYLKPFELTVKEGESKALMAAFNRIGATWTAASKSLMTEVLREEWGFNGVVITDNSMVSDAMSADMALAAGTDLMLSSTEKAITIDKTAEGRNLMRQACHNILYVVANSNALELVRVGVPGWIFKLVFLDAVLLGLLALGFVGCTKKKKLKLKVTDATEKEEDVSAENENGGI